MPHARDQRDAEVARDASEPKPQNSAGSASFTRQDAAIPTPNAERRDAALSEPHCKPGVYAGTFSGSIQVIGLSLSSVTGTVRAELALDASGEHLAIDDARVVGVDQNGNSLTVDLSGRINCASERLEDGRLENGTFRNASSNTGIAFTGTTQGMYAEDPHSVVGTWSGEATDAASLLTGQGTWSLTLSH
jgi:hypothetical protein